MGNLPTKFSKAQRTLFFARFCLVSVLSLMLFSVEAVSVFAEAQQATLPASQPLETTTFSTTPVLTDVLSKTDTLPITWALVLQRLTRDNLSLQGKRMQEKAQGSAFGVSVAKLLPDVVLSYDQNRFKGAIQVFSGQPIPISRTTLQPQAALNWSFNPAGRDVWLAKAQKYTQKAAGLETQAVSQQVLRQGLEAYFYLLQGQLQREVALQALKAAEEEARVSALKMNAGVLPKLDSLRSDAQVLQRKGELLQAETELATSEQTLLELLNLKQDLSLLPDASEAAMVTWVSAPYDVATLLQQTWNENPLIKQWQAQQKVTGMNVRAAWAALAPDVQLRLYANRVGPSVSELENSNFAGVSIQLNAFKGLGLDTYFKVKQGQQLAAASLLELEAKKKELETKVTQAVLTLRQAQQGIALAQSNFTVAQEAQRLAKARYSAGVAIQLEVLEAADKAIAAKKQYITAILSYNRAQLQVLEATGRLTPETLLGLRPATP